jgi:hypothetical protein
MRGDVGEFARTVAGHRDDLAVAHDNGAYRNLAALAGGFRLFESEVH